jgi:catechol 2,3-dioxygenase-like lactoylglutathione lyase family enzyme
MENGVISFESAVPQFTVPDLVRTGEYYRDVLGFQIVGYWDGEQVTSSPKTPPMFAIVQRDRVEVFFSRADQPEVRTRPTSGAPDVYLRVTGIDALAEELRARGAEILDGPEDRIYGQRELVVMDCNGLILCFGEDTRAPLNSTLDVRKVGTDE